MFFHNFEKNHKFFNGPFDKIIYDESLETRKRILDFLELECSLIVTAFNNNGAGEGSTTSTTKENFITLYTATPVADLELYTASSVGS